MATKLHGNDSSSDNREVFMWRAVIGQAFVDATKPILRIVGSTEERRKDSRYQIAVLVRDRARHWLTTYSQDFQEVCNLALVDPEAVRDRALFLKRNDWPRQHIELAA